MTYGLAKGINVNSMPNLFDFAEGKRLRDLGIEMVSSWPRSEWVDRARAIAIMHASRFGTVCADDLHAYIAKGMLNKSPHHNCFGAVFKTKKLRFVRFKQSERIARKTGVIRVYECNLVG